MLKGPSVLLEAIRKGLSMMVWEKDSFAYADSYDDATKRYRGLQAGSYISLPDGDGGILVRPETARKQMNAEDAGEGTGGSSGTRRPDPGEVGHRVGSGVKLVDVKGPRIEGTGGSGDGAKKQRYHGSVTLDQTRVAPDAGQIADEVIAHLTSILGADVKVALHIEANIPNGVPKHTERTVIENSRNLNFDDSGFEDE